MFSYRQTIHAYPNGGGSYIVSKDNLGTMPGLVAGASLLVDYTLTVAVSIAAGTAAITSAVEPLRGHGVATVVVLLVGLAAANLRGLRESGRLFAPPTYGYIAIMTVFLGYGLIRSVFGDLGPLPVDQAALDEITHNGALLGGRVARPGSCVPFSSGAIALSGVEAISNGVPAFRPPEARTQQGPHVDRDDPGRAVLRRGGAGAPAPADPERGRDDPLDDGPRRVRQRTTSSTTCCSSSPWRS